jgi:tRNA 2-thiouridine synthesizing protein A
VTEERRPSAATPPRGDVAWDAGDLACGDLILQLRGRMEAMLPGHVLRLVALDSGAPEDLPAWCRLTGHTLVSATPPVYLIRRKER